MAENPYAVLGVSRERNWPDEVKKAYRKKARENHPDLNPNDPAAAERMNRDRRGVRPHREPGEVRGARPARRRRATRALGCGRGRRSGEAQVARAATGTGGAGGAGQAPGLPARRPGLRLGRPLRLDGRLRLRLRRPVRVRRRRAAAPERAHPPRGVGEPTAPRCPQRDRRPSTRAGFQQAVGQPERRGRADGRDARWHETSRRPWPTRAPATPLMALELIRQRGAAWTRAIRTTSARSGSSSSAGHRATGRRGRRRASAWASWTPGPICCGVWCCGPAALPPVRALLLNSAARYGAPPAPRAGTTKGTRIRERRSASTWEPRTAARPTVEGGQVPPSCPTRKASAPRRAWWRSRRTASGWWELRGVPGRRPMNAGRTHRVREAAHGQRLAR